MINISNIRKIQWQSTTNTTQKSTIIATTNTDTTTTLDGRYISPDNFYTNRKLSRYSSSF